MKRSAFLHSLGLAIDYAAQIVCFWHVLAPMTVSSRAGLALRDGKTTFLARFGRFLNWIDPGHTEAAIQADISRALMALRELGHH